MCADTHDKLFLLQLAFKDLKDDELQEMAKHSHFHTYPAGHVLCQEGAEEDVFYIIADGRVIITQKLGDEEGERILREGGKGDVIGEMALIQSAPRSATVRTTSACTTLEMDKEDFATILRGSPRLAIEIIRVTLDRIRENDRVSIEDLKNTNKVLRQLDRNKLDFIQVASHELRTPLTVLKGYVELLDSLPEFKANPAASDLLAGINKGTARMHEVVNLMLDVSRMDAENLEIASVPVLLKQLIEIVVNEFENAASERNIEITTRYAAETPDIQGDPELLQKALYHLVINAIKYTPDGGKVTVSVNPTKIDKALPAVEISVKDTGIGLDSEHHELVFEKFYQVGSVEIHSSGKTSFKGGGPGLGLAIVRGVARVHGGKTWVESAGHDETNFPGSVFILQLPLNPPGQKSNVDTKKNKE